MKTWLADTVEEYPPWKNLFSSHAIEFELHARRGSVFDFLLPYAIE